MKCPSCQSDMISTSPNEYKCISCNAVFDGVAKEATVQQPKNGKTFFDNVADEVEGRVNDKLFIEEEENGEENDKEEINEEEKRSPPHKDGLDSYLFPGSCPTECRESRAAASKTVQEEIDNGVESGSSGEARID